MRKRMARHIDSCDTCEQDQRRQVNPVALLGGRTGIHPGADVAASSDIGPRATDLREFKHDRDDVCHFRELQLDRDVRPFHRVAAEREAPADAHHWYPAVVPGFVDLLVRAMRTLLPEWSTPAPSRAKDRSVIPAAIKKTNSKSTNSTSK